MANAPKANVRKRNASRKGGASATRKTAQAPARQRFALPWLNHLMIFAGVAFVAVAVVAMALIRPVVTRVPAVAASLPSYVIGSIAAYWLFDRAASLL